MAESLETESPEVWQEKIGTQFECDPRMLIPVLQYIQNDCGYLPTEAITAAARHLRVSEAKVYGVASFYAQFHFEPRGRNTVTVCRGTACHVRGSGKMLQDVENHLGVKAGETTEDLSFSVETVACYGSCALAPVVVINERVMGGQTSAVIKGTIDTMRPQVQGDVEEDSAN